MKRVVKASQTLAASENISFERFERRDSQGNLLTKKGGGSNKGPQHLEISPEGREKNSLERGRRVNAKEAPSRRPVQEDGLA